MTNCLARTTGCSSSSTVEITCGFTARISTLQASMISRFVATGLMPVAVWNFVRASATGSAARLRATSSNPAFVHADASAVAICPAPRKPIASGNARFSGIRCILCSRGSEKPIIATFIHSAKTRAPPMSALSPAPRTGWASLKDLTRYQWFVFIVCCAAWDLDCMDQQLFVLARDPALPHSCKSQPAIRLLERWVPTRHRCF